MVFKRPIFEKVFYFVYVILFLEFGSGRVLGSLQDPADWQCYRGQEFSVATIRGGQVRLRLLLGHGRHRLQEEGRQADGEGGRQVADLGHGGPGEVTNHKLIINIQYVLRLYNKLNYRNFFCHNNEIFEFKK